MPATALAASISWIGGTDDSWFTAANWSPAQVPTSADSVVIDASVRVTAPTPGAAFQSLTLGDASASFTPTLALSAAATGGTVTVSSGAVLEQDTAAALSLSGLQVQSGGLITQSVNVSSRAAVVNLSVSGNMTVSAGGAIIVDGRGYAGSTSPTQAGFGTGGGTPGGYYSGSGGGHGGAGGASDHATAGGSAYESPLNPTDMGSGGASSWTGSSGGGGGGAVLLSVAGTLTLSGVISAQGATPGPDVYNGTGGGAGAGGTVNISAGSLAGTGAIFAGGGNGTAYGGAGGGGGRVAVSVSGTDSSSLAVHADAGIPSHPSSFDNARYGYAAGAGTIAIQEPGSSTYNLTIGTTTIVPQAATPLSGAAPAFGAGAFGNAIVTFDPGSSAIFSSLAVTGASTVTASGLTIGGVTEIKPGGFLSVNAVGGGALTVDGGGTLQQTSTQTFSFATVQVQAGGLVTHAPNVSSRTAVVDLAVSGNMTVAAGGSVVVDGLGYAGGSSPGQTGFGPGGGASNGNHSGAGGGHGGNGGASDTGGGNGSAYDSVTNPLDLGSGGAVSSQSNFGGAGGGCVILSVGGTLTVDGLVSAAGSVSQGYGGFGGGAGAGGTVNVSAVNLAGSGQISVMGGNGSSSGGAGGGGGRIAVAVSGSDASALTLRADAGIPSRPYSNYGYAGGAGTIAAREPGNTLYNLSIGTMSVVPQAATPLSGAAPAFGAATFQNSVVAFDGGSAANFSSLAVTGVSTVTAANLTVTGTSEIKAGGFLTVNALNGGSLSVDGGGTLRQSSTLTLRFSSVTIQSGGLVTHMPNVSSRTAVVNLASSGDMTLAAGSSIIVDGLGYAGGASSGQMGFGPGGGASSGNHSAAGGGHGGDGGATDAGVAGGAGYDSVTNPVDLGSGGAVSSQSEPGGAGGGCVILSAGGTLTVDGLVSAAGAASQGYGGYGGGAGAGGTVNVSAGNLAGTGQIAAVGGNGSSSGGAGGGGGRIAVAVSGSDASALTLRADAGIPSRPYSNYGYAGGAGTIAAREPGNALYNLSIGTMSVVPQAATRILGASPSLSTVTVVLADVVFDGGSAAQIGYLNVVGQATMTASAVTFASGGAMAVVGGTLTVSAASISGGNLVVAGGGSLRSMTPTALVPSPGFSLNFPLITLGASSVLLDSATSVQAGGIEVYGPSTMSAGGLTFPSGGALEINNGGLLALSAGALSGANLLVHGGGTFMQANAAPLSLNSASVDSGGTLTHASNGALKTAMLAMNVSGNFNLSSGGQINVDGRGYQGGTPGVGGGIGYGPGGGGPNGSRNGAGAGHGGAGADGDNGSIGGLTYDSPVEPSDLGSGGGAAAAGTPGGAGGGEARIQVGGTFALNGTISADGATGFNNNGFLGGSGSGGTVVIHAANVTGSGLVRANGGQGAGGGGGGRVVFVSAGSKPSVTLQANGGTGYSNGAQGVVTGNSVQFDPTAPSSSTLSASLQQQLTSDQALTETLSAQSLDFSGATSTGVFPATFLSAKMKIVTVQSGSFAGMGFFTGSWSLPNGQNLPMTGQWMGTVHVLSSPREIVVKGAIEGGLRGVLDGVLTESTPGSGNFNQLALNGSVFESDELLGSGGLYITGSGAVSPAITYSGVNLDLSQASFNGQTDGDSVGPLQTTFSLLRVNNPGNPYNGMGFLLPTYSAAPGAGSGWAYASTYGKVVTVAGLFDVPLRRLFEASLVLGLPESFFLDLERLTIPNIGTPLTPQLVVNTYYPQAAASGAVDTYDIQIQNVGRAGDSVTVVAEYPNWTDFVSASSTYTVYMVSAAFGSQYPPRPFVRWDNVFIPPLSYVQLYYQVHVRLPTVGAPGGDTGIGGSVQVVDPAYANKVFAGVPTGMVPYAGEVVGGAP